ncbi:MAG: YqzL family protein [Candidatus Eremiobacteraeota bacterium]|nr:YqzL family protein [Candidatus Eremiobacteraeota bacterium]MBC5826991.1 YqzL family protein [Candidatus Eremiobacteraeota bacterium]
MLAPELFWKLFKSTGSVKAYLLYKRLTPQVSH